MWRFAPDVDPTTPQIYTDMARMLPTPWGAYRTSPSAGTALGGLGGSNVAQRSALFVKTDGTVRWLAATLTAIYDSDATGASWTSRVSGLTSSQLWQFAQYGNVSLAVHVGVNPQASTSGNFADLAGTPPKAACVCTQSNAVILANYDDGTAYQDGWWASDIGAHTTWTPAASNQAANGRLLQTPGPITALIGFGGKVIAFKATSVYEGQYVGRPTIWNWRLLHPSIGASCADAVATDGTRLFFFGVNGAYVYDGANFSRVDDGVEKYLQTAITAGFSGIVVAAYSYKERVFVLSPPSALGGGVFYAYCPDSGLWSVGSDANPPSGSTAIATDCLVKVPPGYTRRIMARVGGTSSNAYEMNGTAYTNVTSSVTTGWIGNDRTMTFVSRVIPQFVPAGDYSYNNGTGSTWPSKLTVKTSAKRGTAMSEMTGSPFSIDVTRGRFDFQKSDRWFEFKLSDSTGSLTALEGGMELSGLDIVAQPDGED